MEPNLQDYPSRTTVIDCLREYSDNVVEEQINYQSDLEIVFGLDSFSGIELACEFTARLGVQIPKNDNPLTCVDEDTGYKRFRRLGELLEYLAELPQTR